MSGSSPIPNSSFEGQYKRILEAAECRTQVELADLLGIRQSSISDAKRRQSIPSDWLIKLRDKKYINPDWIRSGIGSMQLPHVVTLVETRPLKECSTQELVNELVRRALQPMDIERIPKEVAATWHPTSPK